MSKVKMLKRVKMLEEVKGENMGVAERESWRAATSRAMGGEEGGNLLFFFITVEAFIHIWFILYTRSYALVNEQVQRQLQLRIEAQGKYLKKIIEEQQRLSGEFFQKCLAQGLQLL
ncbi:MYB-CC type transfactor [Forsythia ovata]|uniref:MYB-CC type transfactor n=1 Tax=Forsythia ovata TaxID=205694 RepID=A0ABD1S737_9LAMI